MTRRAALVVLLLGLAPSAVAQEQPPPADNPNPLATLELESLEATRALPLFTPSRSAPVVEQYVEPEPVEPEPVVEVEAEPTPPALRLIGIVMTASEQVAILAEEATEEIHRIRPGEEYEGWTLRIVDARSVEFRNGDELHALTMFAPGSEPSGPRPAPGADDPIPGVQLDGDGNPIVGTDPGGQAEEGDSGEEVAPEEMDTEAPPADEPESYFVPEQGG